MKKISTFVPIVVVLFAVFVPNPCIHAFSSDVDKQKDSLMIENQLVKYVKYNQWANERLAQWLSGLTDIEAKTEIESSFPSVYQTALHIWNAEFVWLQSLKEESTNDAPSRTFEGVFSELLTGWINQSSEFTAYVKNLDENSFSKTRTFSSGNSFTYADMIHHCMNHSTYHRGQLITMGRQAGLKEPPRTDFIFYVTQ